MFELAAVVLICVGDWDELPPAEVIRAQCVPISDELGPYETEEECNERVKAVAVAGAQAVRMMIGGTEMITGFLPKCQIAVPDGELL